MTAEKREQSYAPILTEADKALDQSAYHAAVRLIGQELDRQGLPRAPQAIAELTAIVQRLNKTAQAATTLKTVVPPAEAEPAA
jgi:hypothetical protein